MSKSIEPAFRVFTKQDRIRRRVQTLHFVDAPEPEPEQTNPFINLDDVAEIPTNDESSKKKESGQESRRWGHKKLDKRGFTHMVSEFAKDRDEDKPEYIAYGNKKDNYFRAHLTNLRYPLVTKEMVEHIVSLDDEKDRNVCIYPDFCLYHI